MPKRSAEESLFDATRLDALKGRFGDFGREGMWQRLRTIIEATPDPDRALSNFERWLTSGGSHETRAAAIDDSPPLAVRLLTVFASSQVVSNELIRDPDAATLLFDAHDVYEPVVAANVKNEATRLFKSAISLSHKLDQLRFLQKRTLARIVWHDLSGDLPAESIWLELSELADGLLQAALDACSSEDCIDPECLSVVAMGKHGSRELNYSSDIDLIFVLDDATEDVDRTVRFCEKFVRALNGKMGRGDLYRIDLRLRPFGKAGPVAHTISALSRYLENYAEPWELQALVRARPIAGGLKLGERFLEIANQHLYKGARSDWFFESLLETKMRAEVEASSASDFDGNLKHGSGGIRDIEFVVQTLQLVAGRENLPLRGASTMSAAAHLFRARALSEKESTDLAAAYRFFRQVEHRIQLTHSFHTHTLPKSDRDRAVLARLMRFPDWATLDGEVRKRKAIVRRILVDRFPRLASVAAYSNRVIGDFSYSAGSREAESLTKLLAAVSGDVDQKRDGPLDADTTARVRLLVERAPRVVSEVAFHSELWDVAFSEEVEFTPEDDVRLLAHWRAQLETADDRWDIAAGALARRLSVTASVKLALHGDAKRSSQFQTAATDLMLLSLLDRCGGSDVDIIALGSYGAEELLLCSDWDVMLLAHGDDIHPAVERAGEEWMRVLRRIGIGSPLPVDVRLRPEGRSGLIVRSLSGLTEYANSAMEPWERLAYARARSLRKRSESTDRLLQATYSRPWSSPDEAEAAHMRKRVHAERTQPSEAGRDLKLGPGSLFDIEWLTAVLKLRTHTSARNCTGTVHSLRRLADENAITILERDTLTSAHELFSLLRNAMYLLELDSDSVLPENPDKLARIADWVKVGGANELLRIVDECHKEVQAVFESILGEESL